MVSHLAFRMGWSRGDEVGVTVTEARLIII